MLVDSFNYIVKKYNVMTLHTPEFHNFDDPDLLIRNEEEESQENNGWMASEEI